MALAAALGPTRAEPVAPGMQAQRVARGAYVVTVDAPYPGNTLVLDVGPRDLVIVSAPYTTDATNALLAWARRRFGARRLTAVNTHFHPDGTGGNAALLA